MVAVCEKKSAESADNLDYDERNPFVPCGEDLVPIYKGSPSKACPYCSASFIPAHEGKV